MICSWLTAGERATKGETCAEQMTDSFQVHKDVVQFLSQTRLRRDCTALYVQCLCVYFLQKQDHAETPTKKENNVGDHWRVSGVLDTMPSNPNDTPSPRWHLKTTRVFTSPHTHRSLARLRDETCNCWRNDSMKREQCNIFWTHNVPFLSAVKVGLVLLHRMRNTTPTFDEEAHPTQNYRILTTRYVVEVKKNEVGNRQEKSKFGENCEFQHLRAPILTSWHGCVSAAVGQISVRLSPQHSTLITNWNGLKTYEFAEKSECRHAREHGSSWLCQ